MNITRFRTHVAVALGKKSHTEFNCHETSLQKGAKFTLIDGLGIQVDFEGRSIVVPMANIPFFEIETEVVEKKLSKAK